MTDAIHNSKQWDIVLEGSSYALYSIYNAEAEIQYASNWNITLSIHGRMQEITIHYLGWPGLEQTRLRNSINSTATILFYDLNETNSEKEYNKWINNSDYMEPYMVGCDEDHQDTLLRKSINKASGLLEFETSIDKLLVTDVFLTILEDIADRTYSKLEESPLDDKNNKCNIM